jgi:hypothetical protein
MALGYSRLASLAIVNTVLYYCTFLRHAYRVQGINATAPDKRCQNGCANSHRRIDACSLLDARTIMTRQ